MYKYSITVQWSDGDEGYIATIPELLGLSAFGETQEQAVSELKIAMDGYLESMEEAGETIPEPELLSSYSGQLRIRMPKTLHARLAIQSKNEKISLNTYIISLLSEKNAQREIISNFIASQIKTVILIPSKNNETFIDFSRLYERNRGINISAENQCYRINDKMEALEC